MSIPCNCSGVPSRRDGLDDPFGERERSAFNPEVEEGDEVAVDGQGLGARRILRPCAPFEAELVIEEATGDFPCH